MFGIPYRGSHVKLVSSAVPPLAASAAGGARPGFDMTITIITITTRMRGESG
jgi:hypothetical protein